MLEQVIYHIVSQIMTSKKEHQQTLLSILEHYWSKNLVHRLKTHKELNDYINEQIKETWVTKPQALYILKEWTSIEDYLCPVCKTKLRRFNSFQEWHREYCSVKCSSNSEKKKIQIKETNIKKYWCENPNQNEEIKKKNKWTSYFQSEEFKKKRKQYNLESFWYESYSQHPDYNKKKKITLKEKYWSENYNNKEKRERTMLEKYGVKTLFEIKEINEKAQESQRRNKFNKQLKKLEWLLSHTIIYDEYKLKLGKWIYSFKCLKCWTEFDDYLSYNIDIPRCSKCNPKRVTKWEIELYEMIKNVWEDVVHKTRKIIEPLELDIYCESKKLAIEYNWLMFHSIWKSKYSIFDNSENESLEKNKLKIKIEKCLEQNIQLFHIFETEWENPIKKEIWKSLLRLKLGKVDKRIYARKCSIKELTSKEYKDFLDNNHLQWSVTSSINLWLYYHNELVQVMTFSKSRFSKEYTYELYRLCTKRDYLVIGWVSKIFKFFCNKYLEKWETVVTYADRRYSKGEIYQTLGFRFLGVTPPNYYYFKEWSNNLESRLKYQKHKLKDILINYDNDITESENMYNHWYRKIYDCWNLKFLYRKE